MELSPREKQLLCQALAGLRQHIIHLTNANAGQPSKHETFVNLVKKRDEVEELIGRIEDAKG